MGLLNNGILTNRNMNGIEYLRSKGILEIEEGLANDADNATYINERMVVVWLEEYHQAKLKSVDLADVSDLPCIHPWKNVVVDISNNKAICHKCKKLIAAW